MLRSFLISFNGCKYAQDGRIHSNNNFLSKATEIIKKRIKSKIYESTPVVGLTAYVSQNCIKKCYDSGMNFVCNLFQYFKSE